MASLSLQRSKKRLEKEGWTVGITEKWQSFFGRKGKGPPGVRVDLFGLWDLVAVKLGETGVLGIQCCADDGGDVSVHINKLTVNPILETWLLSGNTGIIMGWGKRGPVGKRKTWTCRVIRMRPGGSTQPVQEGEAYGLR